MTTDWAHLTHAYGSAADTPGLFARLDGGPGDKDVWADLWSSLCHQGTVYDASFAALPLLADIATGRAPGAREEALLMAGLVVGAAGDGERQLYGAQIAELLPVARDVLAGIPADAPGDFVYHLQGLLAFEGVPFWATELELLLEEFEVTCPECGGEWALSVGEDREDFVIELLAVDAAELSGIGARLHALALGGGQSEVAESLTRLFGRARCAECEAVFKVAEALVGQAVGGAME
ncbi:MULTISPECIES: hypothetical protein [unclassified Streptomyces]|uniref:hypothetical protein n=1 Tax=unclassified Streptomyces TaxID=2593676 RepID=UPI000DD5EDE6|nr:MULTISPECIES: hypothetical protein [unclassified Streptomyces]QZZ26493.1 hypothetical protein A7X85_09725 [Streptomyces sp. ST1015]